MHVILTHMVGVDVIIVCSEWPGPPNIHVRTQIISSNPVRRYNAAGQPIGQSAEVRERRRQEKAERKRQLRAAGADAPGSGPPPGAAGPSSAGASSSQLGQQ